MKLLATHTLILGAALLTSCVNYPENYTYSPNVTVNGDSGGHQSPVVLPNPFATNKSNASYSVEYVPPYRPQPSPLTARIPRPPVSTQFYYDDEDQYAQSDFEQPVEEMTFEAY